MYNLDFSLFYLDFFASVVMIHYDFTDSSLYLFILMVFKDFFVPFSYFYFHPNLKKCISSSFFDRKQQNKYNEFCFKNCLFHSHQS